ncbi:MAG: hypothetical protein WBA35_12890 [Litorimonas sp.]
MITFKDIIDHLYAVHREVRIKGDMMLSIHEKKVSLKQHRESEIESILSNGERMYIDGLLEGCYAQGGLCIIDDRLEDLNVSLIDSVLRAVSPSYISSPDMVKRFTSMICYYIEKNKLFGKFKYAKLKWQRQQLILDIMRHHNKLNTRSGCITLRCLSDMFTLNVFVHDYDRKVFYVCYGTPQYCKYRSFIILLYRHTQYSLIYHEERCLFNHNDKLFSYITRQKVNVIDSGVSNIMKRVKTFEIGEEDVSKYLHSTVDIDDQRYKYKLMGRKKLIHIATQLGIDVRNGLSKNNTVKYLTSKAIIELIINHGTK